MARFICVESTIADLHTVGKKYQKMIDWCIRVIEAQPVADVAPVRHGEWVHDGFDIPHGVDWMHCSICNRREPHVPAAMTTYCPGCGAKMDGGEGDD